jgi:hypothetical protein
LGFVKKYCLKIKNSLFRINSEKRVWEMFTDNYLPAGTSVMLLDPDPVSFLFKLTVLKTAQKAFLAVDQ